MRQLLLSFVEIDGAVSGDVRAWLFIFTGEVDELQSGENSHIHGLHQRRVGFYSLTLLFSFLYSVFKV